MNRVLCPCCSTPMVAAADACPSCEAMIPTNISDEAGRLESLREMRKLFRFFADMKPVPINP